MPDPTIIPHLLTQLGQLLACHQGQPAAVATMLSEAIHFVQTQAAPGCDAELQQAIVADLQTVQAFFAGL